VEEFEVFVCFGLFMVFFFFFVFLTTSNAIKAQHKPMLEKCPIIKGEKKLPNKGGDKKNKNKHRMRLVRSISSMFSRMFLSISIFPTNKTWRLVWYNKNPTITSWEIQNTIRLVLLGYLPKNIVS
jgi:hypothetical protein